MPIRRKKNKRRNGRMQNNKDEEDDDNNLNQRRLNFLLGNFFIAFCFVVYETFTLRSETRAIKQSLVSMIGTTLVQNISFSTNVYNFFSNAANNNNGTATSAVQLNDLDPRTNFSTPAVDSDVISSHEEDVTIIVTTNLIPTSPSIEVVNQTIRSMPKFLEGLSPTTPLIITVDGLDEKMIAQHENATQRWEQYVQNLKTEFHKPHKRQLVLPQTQRINLIGNLQEALRRVRTEFVYIIQHDMPFQKQVNHTALIMTMKEYPPPIIKLVRFNYIKRHADKMPNRCNPKEIEFTANNITLTKHQVWSDNNHLTRTTYYDELWTFMNRSQRFMEHDMRWRAWDNCSYWGTHLYGTDYFNVIGHLDGRFNLGDGQFVARQNQWKHCKNDRQAEREDCIRRRVRRQV